jgi:hypothetical protein
MSARNAIRLVRGRFSGRPLPDLVVATPEAARPSSTPSGWEAEASAKGDGGGRAPLDYAEDERLPLAAKPMFSLCEKILLISISGMGAVALWVGLTSMGACG